MGMLDPAVAPLFKLSNEQQVAMMVKMILDTGYAIRSVIKVLVASELIIP